MYSLYSAAMDLSKEGSLSCDTCYDSGYKLTRFLSKGMPSELSVRINTTKTNRINGNYVLFADDCFISLEMLGIYVDSYSYLLKSRSTECLI